MRHRWLLPNSRPVWRSHTWVFAVWLLGVACVVAMLVGFIFHERWRFLAMAGACALGLAHQRLVTRLGTEEDL